MTYSTRLTFFMLCVACIHLFACTPDSGQLSAEPAFCQPSGIRPSFTVATYNIHAGVGRDGKRDVRRSAATIKEAQIVGLQEVDNERPRSSFDNQAKTIARTLGHAFWQHFPAENYWPFGTYGNAVTSSLPIIKVSSFDLPRPPNKSPRRLAWAKVLVDCRPVNLFVVHMTRAESDPDTQMAQTKRVLALIEERTGGAVEPTILLGDFNLESNSQAVALIRVHFSEGRSQKAGSNEVTTGVDHIFVAGGLTVLATVTEDDGASDHAAIVATLR